MVGPGKLQGSVTWIGVGSTEKGSAAIFLEGNMVGDHAEVVWIWGCGGDTVEVSQGPYEITGLWHNNSVTVARFGSSNIVWPT